MTEKSKDLWVWIVGLLLIAGVIFEEARFSRRHNESPSFPVRQVSSEKTPTPPANASAKPSTAPEVKFAKSGDPR